MSDPRYQIDVSVVTRYLKDQSDPESSRFAFAYTITVQNNGLVKAKLLSRHWLITNGDGEVEEVRGAGVGGRGTAAHDTRKCAVPAWSASSRPSNLARATPTAVAR